MKDEEIETDAKGFEFDGGRKRTLRRRSHPRGDARGALSTHECSRSVSLHTPGHPYSVLLIYRKTSRARQIFCSLNPRDHSYDG